MVVKDEVLQWFKESPSSSRVGTFCRLARYCTPFELRFFYTVLEDLLKDCYQAFVSAEKQANSFSKPSLDPKEDRDHLCNSFKVSDIQQRADCLATLALLKRKNHAVASQVLYPVLSTITRENVIEDKGLCEEVLLMMYMAANHPAFSFAERRVLWEKVDMVSEVASSHNASPSTITDQERGLTKKERTTEAKDTSYSELEDWADMPSTNWGDCEVVVPESLVVTGCQKSKGGRFDVRFEYVFEVNWSDGGFNRCFKTYSELFQFQNKLLNENPSAAGKGGGPRIIPFIPGKKPLTKSTRDLAEKRLPEIREYALKLAELPQDILSSQLVVDFFGAVSTASIPVVMEASDSPGHGSGASSVDIGRDSLSPEPRKQSLHSAGSGTTIVMDDSRLSSVTSDLGLSSKVWMGERAVANEALEEVDDLQERQSSRQVGDAILSKAHCIPRIGGGVVYYSPDHMTQTGAAFRDHIARSSKSHSGQSHRDSSHSSNLARSTSSSSSRHPNSASKTPNHRSKRPSSLRDNDHFDNRSLSSAMESADAGDDPSQNAGRHTEPTPRRSVVSPSPSNYSVNSLGQAGSTNSLLQRPSTVDQRTFSSMLDWLKALRLHKYATTLESYTFSMLMDMTPEDIDGLEMTTGARAKLATHLDWMRKNDCRTFTVSCKVSSSEHSTDRVSLSSWTQSRTNSVASLDKVENSSLSASFTSATSPTTYRKSSSPPMLSNVNVLSFSPSSASLPEASSLEHLPSGGLVQKRATPDSGVHPPRSFHISTTGGSGRSSSERSHDGDFASRSLYIKLPPGRQPRQFNISDKGRQKRPSSSPGRSNSHTDSTWRSKE